ncbi:hypothetical protein M2323_004452 [Rhodoblastus acidophilus]|uniref:DUF1937 family protein n=1 Tax=Rhodoblastus acidophilus TaxID=1074 RepID=UPI0022258A48|nr:DUF1937 family protein [Rhodoblastus acidophilus]MCW2286683.1 hypothetical protein [Rhodoblastus acidophilus]MCW2335503.1 hypothetical protein [Rhodoblastus acidophilus]
MFSLLYLSSPYSSPNASIRAERVQQCQIAMARLMASGHLVVCPVVMNHEAVAHLTRQGGELSKAYWIAIESALATACDELSVLQLPGWQESRGVAREITLFEKLGKPVKFISADFVDPVGGVLGAEFPKSVHQYTSK